MTLAVPQSVFYIVRVCSTVDVFYVVYATVGGFCSNEYSVFDKDILVGPCVLRYLGLDMSHK